MGSCEYNLMRNSGFHAGKIISESMMLACSFGSLHWDIMRTCSATREISFHC